LLFLPPLSETESVLDPTAEIAIGSTRWRGGGGGGGGAESPSSRGLIGVEGIELGTGAVPGGRGGRGRVVVAGGDFLDDATTRIRGRRGRQGLARIVDDVDVAIVFAPPPSRCALAAIVCSLQRRGDSCACSTPSDER